MFLALGFGAFIVTGNVLTNESGNWHKGQMSDAVYFDHTLGPDGGYASFGADLYPDSILTDTVPPPEEREGDFVTGQNGNPFDLKDPPAITQTVEYDPETGYYLVTEKVGNAYYRPPTYMTFDEYQNFIAEQEQKDKPVEIDKDKVEDSKNDQDQKNKIIYLKILISEVQVSPIEQRFVKLYASSNAFHCRRSKC
jgi:hypothetical protein